MAIKPSPDRSDLESKTREDLQTIAKVKGVEASARASKASLIEAIMGETPAAPVAVSAPASALADSSSESGTRAIRSRRTVATPSDDFEDLIGEFAADSKVDTAPVAEPTSTEVATNGADKAAPRQYPQSRPERQPRDFSNDSNNRSRRNRRNRNGSGNTNSGGRERFNGESMPNADQPYAGELVEVEGLLDLRDDGYGFLRTKSYHSSPNDVYVSINQVRRYHLRKGDTIVGGYRPAASNEKYPALLRVDTVAGVDPEVARLRPRFEDLTPLFPDEKLKLETNEGKTDLTPRIVDLLSPIGKGQRGLIVSPPKAGKTTIMKQIAQSIEANNPEVHLMVLLVDERPEEVTDIRRSVQGEVISSTFDRPAEEHTHVAELCIERAKRLVEQGRDVVIILDGITRLARAYNLAAPATGRIMSGGVDSGALYPPKKFFGAARNIEEGGSLTILASALVETGSKMDEVIFEEFKGTGNMELRLDRRLAERRLYPAIDVNGSSTRHEELLFARDVLPQVWKLRRVLNGLAAEGREAAGLELLIDKLKSTKSNDEFLAEIAGGPASTS
ncbi:MAG TPA: transcription termination factor Rho [Acidimicrobiales bacterium]